MAEISFQKVSKTYENGVRALEDFSLDVADGEFVVLVGPSGCGKTTALRLAAGLEAPTSGDILIAGRSMRGLPPGERGVAMIFQGYALYEQMTAYENMAFALRARNLNSENINERVREAARLLGVGDCLERPVKTLSGGQRQRVAIGRALVCEPGVFLMDEPLANLDTALRAKMREELIELRRSVGASFIYVTHDQTEAMTLGDRIAVMNGGRICQIGSPKEVYERPRDVFTAGFIGEPAMNFFKARLKLARGGCSVSALGADIPLPLEWRERLASSSSDGAPITLGIRAQDIHLSGAAHAIECSLELAEYVGGAVYLHALAATGERIVARTDESALERGLDKGCAVRMTLESERCCLFDARSGASLLW